ncbi:2'-5' RNA ligase family protein [Pseudonocardia lacus]|uniref:2'-5' RNA ligase family protein n=1 Tax=Pseudonocardia lacus TaxID=2835865 RepID=UPI001BDCB668|nr:2'-5' RNA ligase family protein [Pseudonocardia lacus]
MPPSDEPRLRDHWWPRPGWRPGRVVLTWHLTFAHATDLHALVRTYQRALAPLPGLHPVPPRWLHLTVQSIGFTDEVTDRDLRASTAAVTGAVAALPAFDLVFGLPEVHGEGIAIHPRPAEPVHDLLRTMREALATVLDHDAVHARPDQTGRFRPHVGTAYAGADHPVAPYVEALAPVDAPPVTVPITGISLIRQERILEPEWVYRWTTVTTAPFAARAPGSRRPT